MKSAVLYPLIASLSFTSLPALAQETCHSGADQQPGIGPTSAYPTAADVSDFLMSNTAAAVSPSVTSQSAPQARITVVAAESQNASGSVRGTPNVPSARVRLVTESSTNEPKVKVAFPTEALEKTKPVVNAIAEETVTTKETATAKEDGATIHAALAGLVGTWRAVARRGDGELTTIELQLDDRGWAELTVPGADGKPNTIKRRAELDDKELKLTGPDAELLLGKLIDSTSRQMVLERASGQVTFVRR